MSDDRVLLREAADLLGVSTDTLRRRISAQKLPEVETIDTPHGNAYAIPTAALRGIAEREGWVLDLRDEPPAAAPDAATLTELLMVTRREADAEAEARIARLEAEQANAAAAQIKRRVDQLVGDLEAERAEHSRLRAELGQARQALAVAEAERARADEATQRERALVAEAQQRADAERVRLESEQTRAAAERNRAEALAVDLEAARASFGWRGRRRYARLRNPSA